MLHSRMVIRVALHLKIDRTRVYFCDLAIGAPPVLDPVYLSTYLKRIRIRLYLFLQKCPMDGPRYSSWRVGGYCKIEGVGRLNVEVPPVVPCG
ncbi:hypothetical protein H4582DRAFT_1865992 [Lactarius indigo]|nr:hypothetical protein H4582DRAFT_1865992 [Lactarius indigo]